MSAVLTAVYDYIDFSNLAELERDRTLAYVTQDAFASMFPFAFEAGDAVMWDQRNDVGGLLPVTGLSQAFPDLSPSGSTRFSVPASPYAGTINLPGKAIVGAAAPGSHEQLTAAGEVERFQEELMLRQFQMTNLQIGQLISLGRVSIYNKNEEIVDSLYWNGHAGRGEALAGGAKWDAPSTCDPVTNLRDIHVKFFHGTGYSGRGGARALMSPKTCDYMMNSAAVKAYRNNLGASIVSASEFNEKFANGDFPQVMVVEGTSLLAGGTFENWIPDGYVVFIGKHSTRGLIAGNWVVTSNEAAGGAPVIFANADRHPNPPYNWRTSRSLHGAVRPHSLKQVAWLKVF